MCLTSEHHSLPCIVEFEFTIECNRSGVLWSCILFLYVTSKYFSWGPNQFIGDNKSNALHQWSANSPRQRCTCVFVIQIMILCQLLGEELQLPSWIELAKGSHCIILTKQFMCGWVTSTSECSNHACGHNSDHKCLFQRMLGSGQPANCTSLPLQTRLMDQHIPNKFMFLWSNGGNTKCFWPRYRS